MARTNVKKDYSHVKTEGGSPAFAHTSAMQQLRRSVLACFLYEGEFYEDGQSIAKRIGEAAGKVKLEELAALAIEARHEHNLRHVSLILLRELIRRGSGRGKFVGETIAKVLSRADEMAELLAMYWEDGRKPLAKGLKIGLATAFPKFDAYQLSKYNRDGVVKLRDVLFLSHAKPKDKAQEATWKQLIDGTLPAADTWEVALSGGGSKGEEFTRLLKENKLGYFALLRNLRNMEQGGVDPKLVTDAILARKGGAEKILPFRFIAAARAAPRYEAALDASLVTAISELPALDGTTVVLVDVSGSMRHQLGGKSDLMRMDAAAAVSSLVNAETLRVFSFSNKLVEVPPRRGMAGVDAVLKSQAYRGTNMAAAIEYVNKNVKHDRIIVITDEQDTSGRRIPDPVSEHAYMINVASYKNGVGYGKWTHLDGFSESVLKWIHAYEEMKSN